MSDSCTNNCESCGENCASRQSPQSFLEPQNAQSNIGRVIAVVSGKGGVGKSLVTSLLAVLAQRRGLKAAILDADITGPSITKAFGVHAHAVGTEDGILPVETPTGIELMSVNLLLENETDPVVWRGPVIAGTVKQFWTDVIWGDVDVMLVDCPPGTGDVPLTVFQSLPVDGIVVVTSPQELVSMIVGKAVKMAQLMNVPVLGIVENMSYFECPDCHSRHSVFGESHIDDVAREHGIERVARMPINPKLAAAADKGLLELFEGDWLDKLADAVCGEEENTKGGPTMKIAVTYENGQIFQHFGHTEQFKVYEVENGAVAKSAVVPSGGSGHGALAGFLKEQGIQTLICGGIGGGAKQALEDAGIALYGGVSGGADEAVAAFLAGTLAHDPNVRCSHHDESHGEGHDCGSHDCHSHGHDCHEHNHHGHCHGQH